MHFELVRVRSIANPGRGKKTVFFSRRTSIETVMVSVPLDVLKQYFGIFRKSGPVASAQFLNTGLKVFLQSGHLQEYVGYGGLAALLSFRVRDTLCPSLSSQLRSSCMVQKFLVAGVISAV